MIYNDKYAHEDSEAYPSERDGACINCRSDWRAHHNWHCPVGLVPVLKQLLTFSSVPSNKRFLTQEMLNSVRLTNYPMSHTPATRANVEAMQASVKVDLSDWRAWSHKEPGDCPCGVKRQVCDYHR